MATGQIQGWPSDVPVSEGVKHIVREFYRLLDIYSEAACQQWSQLFALDGEMIIEARDNLHIRGREDLAHGSPALTAERRQSWIKVAARDHWTERIYSHNPEGTELVVLGWNNVVLRNGVKFSQGCAQQFSLRKTRAGDYEITVFKSYIDSAPLARAISQAAMRPQPPMPADDE